MGRPVAKAAGLAAGTLCIAIGLSGQFGGTNLFSTRSHGPTVSRASSPSPRPSPEASPSSQPRPVLQAVTTAGGTIYTAPQGQGGEGRKKHKGH